MTPHPHPPPQYSRELNIALLAVTRAALLTHRVFPSTQKSTQAKSDASPVTIGDYGAQALIIAALRHNFPEDEIVAEEEAEGLRGNDGAGLRGQVWELVRSTKLSDGDGEGGGGGGGGERELGGAVAGQEEMMDLIDAGGSQGGGKGRVWAIDPIDGTKGFLRGGQYAVCLALMVDGDIKVGVLGCPNLVVDDSAPLSADVGGGQGGGGGERGVLFSAVKGQGAESRPLFPPKSGVGKDGLAEGKVIRMKDLKDIKDATFCESVESGHSNHGDQKTIADALGITRESVRMDSQAKYGSIARGAGDLYLRLPVNKDYQEKIWDHAAGDLIVREAGGVVSDVDGRPLDFSLGRTLRGNKGVVAAPREVHGRVLKAVREVLGGK